MLRWVRWVGAAHPRRRLTNAAHLSHAVLRFVVLRLLLAAWLLGLVAMAGGVWATYATCPGCIHRSRVNTACEWTGDSAFPIEPQHADHQKHLVGDAHLAEELAIRHADAEHGRRFGVEHHGGLLDGGRFRAECLSRMLHAIENNHGVTSAQVHLARSAELDL